MYNTIFCPAEILLPDYSVNDERWQKWSVIACDQFTSQIGYWNEAERMIGDAPSTYNMVLPEAYLETERADKQRETIKSSMESLPAELKKYDNVLVYLERTLPDGKIRRGVVGKIDLAEYDFSSDSTSAVRATEATVLERIPPRVAVRREAAVELPHVMLFSDDRDRAVFSYLDSNKEKLNKLYDFELMLGGGHVAGYEIKGEYLDAVMKLYEAYEAGKAGGIVYSVGDGNHSLATAKTHYEEIKASLGDAAADHPARYALVEVVDLGDEAIEFEPIYRLLKNVDIEDFFGILPEDGHAVPTYFMGGEKTVYFENVGGLPLDSMQKTIDKYLSEHPEVKCDYIHGLEDCIELGREEASLALICTGIEKEELFSAVESNGALPRKTFSMGEAKSKRYYIEAREIR